MPCKQCIVCDIACYLELAGIRIPLLQNVKDILLLHCFLNVPTEFMKKRIFLVQIIQNSIGFYPIFCTIFIMGKSNIKRFIKNTIWLSSPVKKPISLYWFTPISGLKLGELNQKIIFFMVSNTLTKDVQAKYYTGSLENEESNITSIKLKWETFILSCSITAFELNPVHFKFKFKLYHN